MATKKSPKRATSTTRKTVKNDCVFKMRGFAHEKLRSIREERGLSQQQLRDAYMFAARDMGIDRTKATQTFSNWELGSSEPDFTDTCIICAVLECTPADLARYVNE